jgi:predicted phosphodiesterase
MTISVISDLHCHGGTLHRGLDVENMKPADVLVVAGDLATEDHYGYYDLLLREKLSGKFRKIIVIRGNHDYYHMGYIVKGQKTVVPSMRDNFVESVHEQDGLRKVDFICTPMWSPISAAHEKTIMYSLNDYPYIPGFTPKKCTALFRRNMAWLERKVRESRNAGAVPVIVTHHLPRRELIARAFEGSEINEAFCVINKEAEERLASLDVPLWIHGHSHNFMDKDIGNTRYVRNPLGYCYSMRNEATGYVKDFIVEV